MALGRVPPPIPSQQEWAELGFTDPVELTGGKQSIVFSAQSDGGVVAVKLTDASLASWDLMERRAAFVSELAHEEASVVPPVKISGQLVHRFGNWFATATSFVDGKILDITVAADAEAMGASLAGLHDSMRLVSGALLPAVSALRFGQSGPPPGLGQYQPLHGDFSNQNLRLTRSGIRIFDFDECGNGPVEFDVANSLYMVLFDSIVNGGSKAKYDDFRTPFLAGYWARSGSRASDAVLDSLIDLRVRALDYWISNPAEAPIGIRTSSLKWIDQLRQFVKTWSRSTDC